MGLPALLGAAAVMLFAPTLLSLVRVWDTDPNYSHGYLVIPFSLWFAYSGLREAGTPAGGQAGLGVLSLTTGVALHLVATLYAWMLVDFLALVFVLRGIAVLVGGREWAAHLTFPILFLFFMFPLPGEMMARVALRLQDIVSTISAGVLDLFFVCYRKGMSLYIAGVKDPLVVAEECSGLRQIVAFLALGAAVGQIGRRSLAFRAVLLLGALPVAVVANLLRVLLMAFGARYFGTDWMAGWLHHAPILFSLPVGVALFCLLDAGLARLWPAPAPAPKEAA